MELDTRSSSNDLSSAPSSDVEGPFVSAPATSRATTITVARDGLGSSAQSNAAAVKAERGAAHSSATRQENVPVKQRKPRKKKEVDPNAPAAPEKEKKPRKPRASAGTTSNARKKLKSDDAAPQSVVSQHSTHTTDLSASKLVQPASFITDTKPPSLYEAAKTTQNGFSNQNVAMRSQPQSPTMPRYQTTPQPQPAVPRSRTHFDPVRGIERSSERTQTPSYSIQNDTPPRPTTFRPSASPAISSILNHPDPVETLPLSYHQPSRPDASRSNTLEHIATANGPNSMSIKLDGASSPEIVTIKPSTVEKPSIEPESKPKRAKEQPPPVPMGSGLLSSSFFGGDGQNEKPETGKGISLVLQIDLNNPENKIFNFSRIAEAKYGFAAVYPRQAAQKERLAKVAAAGAALERSASNSKRGETSVGESGDEDLSVDIDGSDNDGDVAMGGMNGTNENSGTDGPGKRQRKKRKDEYDADDPFVDDSEMLWEAQAAASKDGFFVFMGPLVAEEQKASVDRTEAGTKRGGRGRGRGGGPGSRGGRGGAASAAGGEGTPKPSSSRGGGITRKPRITKAEREQREKEKKQREQAGTALAGKTPTTPA